MQKLIKKLEKLYDKPIYEFDKYIWKRISQHQKLSEDFIREYQDKVDWGYISIHQTLSEEFIREFKDKVNWTLISKYQKLSEDFIREFQDKVYWFYMTIKPKKKWYQFWKK
jgi:hypothetical protein